MVEQHLEALRDLGSNPSQSTKICGNCNLEKDLSQFHFRNKTKGTRQSICKDCKSLNHKIYYQLNENGRWDKIKERRRLYRKRNRKFVKKYLRDHPCVDCGESNPVVLEFDHVRGIKDTEICNLVRKPKSIKSIQNEIDKCEIRCANCHKIKTAERGGWLWE